MSNLKVTKNGKSIFCYKNNRAIFEYHIDERILVNKNYSDSIKVTIEESQFFVEEIMNILYPPVKRLITNV